VRLFRSIEHPRVLGSILIALFIVTPGVTGHRPAHAATAAATPAPVMPLITSSGASNNHRMGGSSINCTAGTGVLPGALVLLAIDVLLSSPPSVTITPPTSGPGIPAWNQIGSTITEGNCEQTLFWHQLGSNVAEFSEVFQFVFNSSVRATCAAAAIAHTCLENNIPCMNPIFDYSSGSAPLSNLVLQTGTSVLGEVDGQIHVPEMGLLLGAFGGSVSHLVEKL